MGDIEKLKRTVESFCEFIGGLPQEELVEQVWGPKEVLAHLVYHQESYVSQVQAILSGNTFKPPQGRFSDLNSLAAESSRGLPIEDLLSRLFTATRELQVLYESCDPTKVSLEIKKGSKRWILVDLVPAVESHIRNHHRQLLIAFKKEKAA